MWNLIKSEWKKIRLPVLASAFLLTTAACVLSTTLYKSYTLQYSLDAWEIGTEIFSLLFPLFVVMPLCWNLYYERRNNFILYVLPRVPAKKYLGAKWLVYALSAFFMLFVPYLLSALCALYINPPVPLNASAGNAAFDHVFLKCFYANPSSLRPSALLLEGNYWYPGHEFRVCLIYVSKEYFCDPDRAICLCYVGKFRTLHSPTGAVPPGCGF